MSVAAVLALLIWTPAASAQTNRRTNGPVSFSVLGGINVAKLSLPLGIFEDAEDLGVDVTNGSRVGPIGGFLAGLPMTPSVTFETGALVSVRGAMVEATVPGLGTAKVDIRMIYLDIPALARLPVAGYGDRRVSVLAGATIGAKLHARARSSSLGQQFDMTFTDELPAIDVGLTVGARADVGRALVVISYTHGLTDTAKGEEAEPIKHRVLSMMAGWRF